MGKTFEGSLQGHGRRFALVVSRFNDLVTRALLEGAQRTLVRHGVKEGDIDVVWVPGSFEIPPVAMRLSKGAKYAAVVCLGTVIRGETPHFDLIAGAAANGIAQAACQGSVPVTFGVVTADSLEQALQRAGAKEGNKGAQAAEFALEMANLYDLLK